MAINVRIDSTFDAKGINQAVKDINSIKSKLAGVQASSKKTQDNFNSFTGSLKKLGLTIAATFGAREIGRFFTSSIKGVLELEAAQNRLRKILITTGGATNGQVDLLLKQANALEKVGVVTKENIIVAQSQLATFDLTANTIEQLTPAILDYVTAEKGAAASAEDFKSMTNGLAQALQGNFASLTKTGFVLDEATKKQIKSGTEAERVTAIIEVLNSTYKGFNKSLLDTPEGQIIKLRQGFGELKEEVGYGLLRSIQLVNDALNEVGVTSDTTTKKLKGIGTEVGLIIEGLGALTAELITTANASERTFKGLAATIVTEIASSILTLPRWIIDFLQGKAPSAQFPKANATPAASRVAQREKEQQKLLEKQTKGFQQSEEAQNALAKTQEDLKRNTDALTETNKNYAEFVAGTSPQSIEGATNLARNSLSEIQKIMAGTPKINATLASSFKELAGIVQKNFAFALDEARTKLNAAKEQYASFKSTIKSSITDVLSFSTIAEGSTFLDSLTLQAEQAKAFGGKIQQLLTMGLNERAITQIANAGYDAGTVIADEIIAGGATIVQQVNTLVASVETVGETVSTSLADQFYSAGVNAAQSLVSALISELNNSAATIAAAIANATQGATTAVPTKAKVVPKKAPTQNPPTPQRFTGKNLNVPSVGVMGFRANGGPVTSGFPYIVGERGPEIFNPSTSGSIIPNNRMGSRGSANIKITVNAGMGANGAQIGKDIVDAIKKYERTSGPVFASA
jgi:hypothetical protein